MKKVWAHIQNAIPIQSGHFISTGLQPGDSWRPGGSAASAAFGMAGKPLKRLTRTQRFNTGLKPGANEKMF
jgi:hypothetical protein